MKSSFGQPRNYLLMAIVAVAVILGIWLLRTSNPLGAGSDSRTTQINTDRALTDLPGSASSPNATDESSDSGGQLDAASASAQTDEAFKSASNDYEPIPWPAEFAESAENQNPITEFHQRLEREPEDPDWALPIERAFADLLGELLDPSLVAVKLIECRSDSCEILAVGYGDESGKEWFKFVQTLIESGKVEQWFDESGDGRFYANCGVALIEPGISGLNCQFSKTALQSEETSNTGPFSLTAPYPDGVDFTLVPVPDDFVRLFETNAEVYDFHRALQAEAVDHSWAPFVESQITEHFSTIPELESVIYHHIECRMTRCEVQLTIPDASTGLAWVLELGEFANQPWNDLEFEVYNVPANDELDRIVWVLKRKDSD